MTLHYDSLPTPFGDFFAAVDDEGRLHATAFGRLPDLKSRVAASHWTHDPSAVRPLHAQVKAYLNDPRHRWTVDVALHGTPHQRTTWQILPEIPVGTTWSYRQLAQRVGSSPRAVGRANATNPICLILPCHRVIGADGSLTGYAFGEERKRALLAWESGRR